MGSFDMTNTSWSVICKSDPRFNTKGRSIGIFNAEAKMNKFIEDTARELGIEEKDIPSDIEISAFKD